MRLTTLLAILAAIVAVPAARLSGLIGASAAPAANVAAAARTPARPAQVATNAPLPTTIPTLPATTPAAPQPAVVSPTVRFVPTVVYTVARVRSSGIDVFGSPSATQSTLHVAGITEFGTPRVLPVIGQRDGWLEIRVPVRPNNATGWIKSADVDLSAVGDEIFVSLATRELEWFHGATLVMQTSAGIGAPTSPTPPGEYYVTDILSSSGAYGPWIVALNGHSDTYTDFAGGDARLAIHGTDDPSSIGAAASHGCVHLPNNLDTSLAAAIQPGTLVEIT